MKLSDMKILWNTDKNCLLMETRNISFEMVLDKIIQNDLSKSQGKREDGKT